MTQVELNEKLKQHKLWLNTKGEEGERAYLICAYLSYADLSYADLTGADLSYADLRGVDLRDADLRGADLRDANLRFANLSGANLNGTGVYFFKGPKHDAIYNSKDDILYVGCQVHTLDYWLENYVDIGKKHEYTDKEIEAYGNWIKSLKELT